MGNGLAATVIIFLASIIVSGAAYALKRIFDDLDKLKADVVQIKTKIGLL